jgi:hypothetical protein
MKSLLLAAALLGVLAGPARATETGWTPAERYVAYAGDVLLTRPLALAATVVGAGVLLATLPLWIASADPAGLEALVTVPAAATFTRCFGCEIENP